MSRAEDVVMALAEAGSTVACAESLTAGMLAATIADVPGCSRVLRGGVVAYATDLKSGLLGVDWTLLAERGPVDADVAVAMADGVRRACDADLGVATTGVAGPDSQGGAPPGLVFIAVSDAKHHVVTAFRLQGTRNEIRSACVERALDLLGDFVSGSMPGNI